jgi:hypothetical protein
MSEHATMDERRRLAEAVKEACLRAAQEGYEHAAISGLCGAGALDAALDAIRMLDVAAVADIPARG